MENNSRPPPSPNSKSIGASRKSPFGEPSQKNSPKVSPRAELPLESPQLNRQQLIERHHALTEELQAKEQQRDALLMEKQRLESLLTQ